MGKPLDFAVHSFAGGVLSSTLDARSDLERYYISARTINNIFVMRSGGAANRSGFEHLGDVKTPLKLTRLQAWLFDEDDRYILEVGHTYIRFWQDGGRLITDGATAQWLVGTYYSVGDLVRETDLGETKIFYCIADNVGFPPFTSPGQWYPFTDVSYSPAATATGIFEVPTPYVQTDVMELQFQQSADVTWIAHPSYPPYELKRFGATSWTMKPANFVPPIAGPLHIAATATGTGSSITDAYKVTAVRRDTLEESLPGGIASTKISTADVAGGSGANVLITHAAPALVAATSIVCVRVYPRSGTKNPAFEAALLNKQFSVFNPTATTFELQLTDGITVPAGYGADFAPLSSTLHSGTTAGTVADDGLITTAAHGLVTGDEILIVFAAAGTTAANFKAIVGKTWTVTVTGPNSFLLNDSDGIVWGAEVGNIYWCLTYFSIAHGSSSPTVTLTWDLVPEAGEYYIYKKANGVFGYLATATETTYQDTSTATTGLSADTGDTPPTYFNPFRGAGKFPAVVGMHDQRLCFGATNEKPADFWLSRVGDFLNFTHSSPFKDDDAINGTIIGAQAIRHMLDLDQLIVVSSAGIYFMEGDGDGNLVPQSIKAKRRAGIGATGVQPVTIDDSVLFVAARGGTVRDFRLDAVEFQKGRDLTTFAPALVDGYALAQWTFQRNPHSVLWAVRDDGRLLGLTYVREQEIAAWHTHDTGASGAIWGDPTQDAGFESVATIPDGDEDSVYAVVSRTQNPVYEYGAKYEPPTGMCVWGLGYIQPNNHAFRALCNDTGLETIPSTANVAGGNPANVLITSQGSSTGSHTGHSLVDGDVIVCTDVWVANADGFAGVTVNGALTGGVQPNGLFESLMTGVTFTVTAAGPSTFELAGTTGITVPANHRCVFMRHGILGTKPAYGGPTISAGSNSSGHGSPAYGVYGSNQNNKALSQGSPVNIRITTATPPQVGQWIRILDVTPSAGPPDLVFEALLEGNDYLVSAVQAATWFEITGTSGITVPATQQATYVVRGTLPNWPGTLGTAYFDKALSGGLGAGIPPLINSNIIISTATPPAVGSRILVIDVTKTAGALQATFEATLEAHSYEVVEVVAGVSFKLKGTSLIAVPANQIIDYTEVTGDINFYSAQLSTAEVLDALNDANSLGVLACVHVNCQDQVSGGGSGTGQIGLDDVLDTHLPVDKYNGIINQLAEIGIAFGTYNKPIMLHIMGECNVGHGYHRANFPGGFGEAWTRIRAAANIITPGSFTKVASCWNTIPDQNDPEGDSWPQWYPGNTYVDWCSIDVFNAAQGFFPGTAAASNIEAFFEFAKGLNKPVYIPESAPVGTQMPDILPDADNGGESDDLARDSAAQAWKNWFGPYLQWIKDHPIIKAVRLLEWDFVGTAYDAPPLFWKNARIAKNKFLVDMWLTEMRSGRWIGGDQLSLLKSWRSNMGLSAETAGPLASRTIERMRVRKAGQSVAYDERLDSFFVDAGATWDGRNSEHVTEGWNTITLALSVGTTFDAHTYATLTASASLFAAGDVDTVGFRLTDPVTGDELEVFVTAFTSATVVTVELQQDAPGYFTQGVLNTTLVWTKMVSFITDLFRMEGRVFNVLGDGVRQPTVAVAFRTITFQKPLGIIQYGLPITAEIETLDLDVPDGKIAGKMVRPVEVTAIVHNTRGALFGPSDGGVLVPMRETPVLESDEVALFSGKATCNMRSSSKRKSSIVIRQTDPLPMLVEGLYPRAEV